MEIDRVKFNLMEDFSGDFGGLEPVFCSLVILDVAKSERVTETFYFHTNTRKLMQMFYKDSRAFRDIQLEEDSYLVGDHAYDDVEMGKVERALFTFSKHRTSSNLFLVLRVSRILQGSKVKKCLDYYTEVTGTFARVCV